MNCGEKEIENPQNKNDCRGYQNKAKREGVNNEKTKWTATLPPRERGEI